MRRIVLFLGMLSVGYAYAQQGKVGINTTSPKATLEIKSNVENAKLSSVGGTRSNEGLLIPKLTKERVADILDAKLVDGTLVYVDNITYAGPNTKVSEITQKGFYYYDATTLKWVKVANGIQGPIGPKGEAMYTATGTPQSTLGKSGDSYVDQNTGFIWTKTGGAWTNTNKSLKGPQGPAGTNGSAGTPGTNGLSMLTGSGTPSNSNGNNGDSYVDQNTGFIWTKTGGAWTNTNKSLKGANGANGTPGTNGSSMLTGSGTPSNSNGNNGDVYLNINDGKLYKKMGGSWSYTNQILQGSKGERGPRGYDGTPGRDAFLAVRDYNIDCRGSGTDHRTWLVGGARLSCYNNQLWAVGISYSNKTLPNGDKRQTFAPNACLLNVNHYTWSTANYPLWVIYDGSSMSSANCYFAPNLSDQNFAENLQYIPINEPLRIR